MDAMIVSLWFLFPPPLDDDRDRFPSREQCVEAMECNRLHDEWLDARQGLALGKEWWQWQEWRQENERLHDIWNQARMLWDDDDEVPLWLRLTNLRDSIGTQAYRDGILPPPVPTWRFRER